jgi:hypothetical protein
MIGFVIRLVTLFKKDQPKRPQNQAQPPPNNGNHAPNHAPVASGGLCIYFLQGRCTYGDNCKYSHGGFATNAPTAPKVLLHWVTMD